MDSNIINAIKRNSDSYSFKLWNRFLENQILTDDEQKINAALRNWASDFNFSAATDMETTLNSFLKEHSLNHLPASFFIPGSTADIFINCHTSFMNHVIHSHDFFEIIYVCEGSISDWIDGTKITLTKGELCIHNPNARHMIEKMNDNEDTVLNILLPPHTFRRSFYSMLMENKELDKFFNNFMVSPDSSSNFMVFHDTSARIDTIIELLAEEFLCGNNASRFVLESTLVVLFGELMRNYKSDPFLQELVSFITEHIQKISMEQTAQEFGYHKNYFPHIVKKQTGRTFCELVTDIRLQKAVNLLLFTEKSIEEISSMIGYKSTASFYCHFKKAYFMTPNEYRLKHI